MAFSFQSGAKGRPTDALVECPYEKYHKVSYKKFTAHLLTCRRNFKLKQLKSGAPIDLFVCQYNPQHLIYSSELIFHESRCEDRHIIRSHQVNVSALKEAGFDFDYTLTKQDDDKEIFQGIHIGMIQGCEKFGKMFKFEDIKYPKRAAQRQAEETARNLAKELEMDRRQEEGGEVVTAEDKAEMEYWNKSTAGPGFDFRKVQVQTAIQAGLKYPPYLTKAERKEFEKRNSGLFDEELERLNMQWEEIPEEQETSAVADDQIPGPSRNARMEWNKSNGSTEKSLLESSDPFAEVKRALAVIDEDDDEDYDEE